MTDNGSIVWEEPPAPNVNREGNRSRPWVKRLTPLVARPGAWARIYGPVAPDAAYNTAGNLSRRKVRIPEGEWEFVGRTIDGQGYVYARYLSGVDR